MSPSPRWRSRWTGKTFIREAEFAAELTQRGSGIARLRFVWNGSPSLLASMSSMEEDRFSIRVRWARGYNDEDSRSVLEYKIGWNVVLVGCRARRLWTHVWSCLACWFGYESLVLTKESSLIRALCQILGISRTDRSREFLSYCGLFAV
jgi:hypothetical protein